MTCKLELVEKVTDEVVDAFQRLLPQLSSSAKPLSAEGLRKVVEAPCNSFFVARDVTTNEIVGSLTLVVFPIPTGIRAWIEDVVVDTKVRGRGIGEALTRAAVERATALGAKSVDLTSRPSREAANRLYQKVGFEKRETNVYRYKKE